MQRCNHRRLLALVLSCLLFLASAPRCEALEHNSPGVVARADPVVPVSGTSTSATTTSTPVTSTSTTTSTPSSTSTSSTTSVTSITSVSSATTAAPTTIIAPTTTTPPSSSVITTTNSAGQPVFVTTVVTASSASSASASQTSVADNDDGGSKALGTGSIVGLSVAGGITVIGIVAFFIWKFTRKRFSDFDDNEAIKWPELNTHGADSHPLPVNNTGRAGFDTESEVSLSRAPSNGTGYANSTPDLHYNPGADPYAVPPLPHLNPNQPYRDDPAAVPGNFYDPYRGPVPNTFNDTASVETPRAGGFPGEAIPMTQMVRGRSPAPPGYETGRASPVPSMGRRSPGPQAAYGAPGAVMGDRARSPGPAAGMGGRQSPGPQAAYDAGYAPGPGMGGRQSPGPHAAYDTGYAPGAPPAGRQSPGPYTVYDTGYGAR